MRIHLTYSVPDIDSHDCDRRIFRTVCLESDQLPLYGGTYDGYLQECLGERYAKTEEGEACPCPCILETQSCGA